MEKSKEVCLAVVIVLTANNLKGEIKYEA